MVVDAKSAAMNHGARAVSGTAPRLAEWPNAVGTAPAQNRMLSNQQSSD
jgi:hypothetical protein